MKFLREEKRKCRNAGGCRVRKAVGTFAFLCLLLMGAVAVQAAPKVASVTKVYISRRYDRASRSMKYATAGTIFIKGAKKNMKVLDFECADRTKTFFEHYGELPSGGNGWMIYVNSEPSPELSISDFSVTVRVKQGGKETSLKTTCKHVVYKPFSGIKINGKNMIKQFPKGYDTITMKLAGQKLKAAVKTKKGYTYDGAYVLRQNRLIRASAAGKLRKGDLIQFMYAKKGWQKGNSYYVIVE